MVFGTLLISSAPVESTILPTALSTGTGGSGVTSDPVAMMIFLVCKLFDPPSFNATETALGPVNEPYIVICYHHRRLKSEEPITDHTLLEKSIVLNQNQRAHQK